jgi:hypothetical protein
LESHFLHFISDIALDLLRLASLNLRAIYII